jgi:hypothetical protein
VLQAGVGHVALDLTEQRVDADEDEGVDAGEHGEQKLTVRGMVGANPGGATIMSASRVVE